MTPEKKRARTVVTKDQDVVFVGDRTEVESLEVWKTVSMTQPSDICGL